MPSPLGIDYDTRELTAREIILMREACNGDDVMSACRLLSMRAVRPACGVDFYLDLMMSALLAEFVEMATAVNAGKDLRDAMGARAQYKAESGEAAAAAADEEWPDKLGGQL